MPKLPQVSGQALVALLRSLGYEVVRQRGSHVQLLRSGSGSTHRITIPLHRTVAKGTLNDVLSQVSARVGLTKVDLVRRLR